jgi:DNA-binding response OmpR family regulator
MSMGQRICIIEDDESIQDILRIILQNAGYETVIFADGHPIMENNYPFPDLFLLDKQLPDLDGLIICEYLKSNSHTKEIPVVMMSAYPNVKELALCAGANDFIEKPFAMSLLLKTIKTQLQKQTAGHVTE